jgi:hypothetical protein
VSFEGYREVSEKELWSSNSYSMIIVISLYRNDEVKDSETFFDEEW